MKHEDSLFRLIKSLSPSQKRYFTLTNAGDSETKYVRLFAAIDALSTYDEDELRTALHGERLLNQLHVAKNYLYELILRTLRSYAHEHSAYTRILNYLQDYENLRRIGLPDLAYKRLLKARELAIEYDHLPFELQTSLEARLHLLKSFEFSEANAMNLASNSEIQQLGRRWWYQTISDQIVTMHNVDIAYGEPIDLEDWVPRLKTEFERSSDNRVRTTLSFNLMCFNYHKFRHDLSSALPYAEANLELLRSNFHLVEDGSVSYPMVAKDYFLCVYYAGFDLRPEFTRAHLYKLVDEIERCHTPRVGEELRTMAHVARLYIEGLYLTMIGEYEDALRAIDHQWHYLQTRGIPNRIIVESEYLALRAKLLLGLGEPIKALDTLNVLLNDRRFAPKIHMDDLILSLFIYEAAGLQSYLPSAIRAVRYRLSRSGAEDVYTALAIRIVQEVARRGGARTTELKKLHQQACRLRKDGHSRNRFLAFELDYWLEARLSSLRVTDVIRREQAESLSLNLSSDLQLVDL